MAPIADDAEDSPPEAGDEDRRRHHPQNPTVLRAAVEIVKRKKAEAVENEDYELAKRFHQKLQELEAQLGSSGASDAAGMVDADGDDAAIRRRSGGSSGACSGDGEEEAASGGGGSRRRRSLLATPNPFRTIELLRQSGYSKGQAYGLLGLLYVAVFGLELLLLYFGWQFMGQGSGSDDDVGEEVYEEY